jgi:acyl carrier protein
MPGSPPGGRWRTWRRDGDLPTTKLTELDISCGMSRSPKDAETSSTRSMQMDEEKGLRAFVEDNFLARKGRTDVTNDESLLDGGLVDSAGIFELVGFVEKTFGVQIDDTEIVPEHFDSINSLAAFVRSKRQE